MHEAKEVSPSAIHALQRLLRLFCSEARRVFDHHLGKSDDRVERRAQLVAHAGEELRLVLARQFELTALVLKFSGASAQFGQQARVLNSDDGLFCESLVRQAAREYAEALFRTLDTPFNLPKPRASGTKRT